MSSGNVSGISIEFLCFPRAEEPIEDVMSCLHALCTLLDSPSARTHIAEDQVRAVHLQHAFNFRQQRVIPGLFVCLDVVAAGCGAAQRAPPAVTDTRPTLRAAAGDDSRAENHPCSPRASGARQEQQE